ncbi:hypothetical protein ACFW04_004331 [Cataglyphis niger]
MQIRYSYITTHFLKLNKK